jgi:hypothetical protein
MQAWNYVNRLDVQEHKFILVTKIFLVQDWESIEKFEAFVNSPALLEIHEKSGVSNFKCHLLSAAKN